MDCRQNGGSGFNKLTKNGFLLLFAYALYSIFRGYFQGINNMVPTAVSQVTEQFIRVTTILVLTPFLIYQGYSLYDAGEGAVFGSVIGGISGLILLLVFFILV